MKEFIIALVVGFVLVFTPLSSYSKIVSFNLHGEVNSNLFRGFNSSTKSLISGDYIYMEIDSPGGYVLVMYQFLNKMDSLKSRNVTIMCTVPNRAASAAAIILMNCDQIKAANNARILFHVANNGRRAYTKYDTGMGYFIYKASLQFNARFIKALLTKSEWQTIVDSKDLVLSGADLMRRLYKYNNR